MRKTLALLAATGLLLSACMHGGFPGQRDYQGEQPSVRGVLGDFCPPGQAMKGYC